VATAQPDVAARRLVAILQERIEDLADAGARAIWEEIPDYRAAEDPALLRDVREHVLEHYRAILNSFAHGRPVAAEDLLFIRRPAGRRVGRVSLADFLHAFRVGQLVLWEAVLEHAVDEDSRRAALGFVTHLIRYINVASTHAAEVYLDAERLLQAEGERVRRDLLEELLAGRAPTPGPRLDAARAAGLDADSPCLVIAATAQDGDGDAARAGASAIVRATGSAVPPLAVVRREEIVVVLGAPRGELRALIARLGESRARLAEHGVRLAIGVSTVHDRLSGAADAYREACAARARAAPGGGLVALPAMSAFDYVTHAADATARRILPAAIRRFVEEDERQGGVLIATLREYVHADLNATLAAERLHLHVNTARYRLAKIEEETGCNLRRMVDVIELLVAVRLAGVAGGPTSTASPSRRTRRSSPAESP
jgi:sugar diacid utilization regulator